MKAHPKIYDSSEFTVFLNRNNVDEIVMEKFKNFPESIIYNNSEYKLNITSVWYGKDFARLNFEINYYSEEQIEYLFNSKVFTDVEKSINYLYFELVNRKFVK